MFPRGLLFFILIMGVDMVLKSLKESKTIKKDEKPTKTRTNKIEEFRRYYKDLIEEGQLVIPGMESKPEKQESWTEVDPDVTGSRPGVDSKTKMDTKPEPDIKSRMDSKPKLEVGTRIKKETSEHVRSKGEIGSEKISSTKGKESKIPKNELKKDVLRGIIFSEILSKPKALDRNGRNI